MKERKLETKLEHSSNELLIRKYCVYMVMDAILLWLPCLNKIQGKQEALHGPTICFSFRQQENLFLCIHGYFYIDTDTHTQRQEHFKPLYKITHSTYVLDNFQNQSLVKYQELASGDEMCVASYSTIRHHFREQKDRNHLEKYTFFCSYL